ncbi:recombinase family protein [Microbacterium sp. Cr-K29]|uniref:recombinase family protein n=1 Tax=unclassified Microbacterium TaxID=2609290 RepID=UPI003FA60766
MVSAVLYLRVSSLGQLEGFGLDVREQACRAYAKARGIRIAATFRDEGVSGTLDAAQRDGLMSALARLQDGDVDALLVARLDRIARTLTVQEAVLAQVWKHNRAVHSADVGEVVQDDPDDPMRTAMRQMAGVFAQLDRSMVVKRMRDGRKAKAAAGGRSVEPAPYGYIARDGGLYPVPEEQDALARMNELRAPETPCPPSRASSPHRASRPSAAVDGPAPSSAASCRAHPSRRTRLSTPPRTTASAPAPHEQREAPHVQADLHTWRHRHHRQHRRGRHDLRPPPPPHE